MKELKDKLRMANEIAQMTGGNDDGYEKHEKSERSRGSLIRGLEETDELIVSIGYDEITNKIIVKYLFKIIFIEKSKCH